MGDPADDDAAAAIAQGSEEAAKRSKDANRVYMLLSIVSFPCY